MDEYAKSLQDVDAALNRLNATLASYKPYAKPVENNVRRQTASAPADSRVNNEAQRQQSLTSDKHGIRKQPRLVPEGTWKDVCELRSHTGSEYCFDPDEVCFSWTHRRASILPRLAGGKLIQVRPECQRPISTPAQRSV